MKKEKYLSIIRSKKAFIIDMDGVIYHGNILLKGVTEFLNWLKKSGKAFLFLTNSSSYSPLELSQKMARLGIEIEPERFYTSGLATASFLKSQNPDGGSVYVIGDPGLTSALYNAGFTMNSVNPDYVVVGEGRNYSIETVELASRLVLNGAKLIGTNPDVTGPDEKGIIPACGALIAPVELTAGRKAYFVGKPNPLMMRHALKVISTDRENTAIIGDRMDTDIIAGIESEIDTVLVLTGVTALCDIPKFTYQPKYILDGVFEIPDNVS